MMKSLFVFLLLLLTVGPAQAQAVYSQPPSTPPDISIDSMYWFDPTGQNDLDTDCAAYDNFALTQTTTITHVEWWGGAPPISNPYGTYPFHGFDIGFYNQDAGTIAFQPDLPAFHGHSPLSYQSVLDFTQTDMGNGLYHFAAKLPVPVTLGPNTATNVRYFLLILARPEAAYAPWGWARGTGGDNKTFYFVRGLHGYSYRYSDRAFALLSLAKVAGKVLCRDQVPTAREQAVTFTFRPTDGSEIFDKVALIGSDGVFQFTDIPRKSYTVHIKGDYTLAKNVTVNTSGGNVTNVQATLIPGDANSDNSIDVFDLDLLITSFDSCLGDGNFIAGSDFNGDGCIDVFDLDILIRYFDLTGDE